jgi:hypothetical protein
MAWWTGWLAAIAIVLAAMVPFVHRMRTGKRGAPGSPPIRLHVALGMTTSALAFLHTLLMLPALGSPAAIGGGVFALLAGGAAFFLLVAHAGLGLQLRDPRLRDRNRKRRMHTTTATLIAIAVGAHAFLLERAAR